jgi:hypothetical protein
VRKGDILSQQNAAELLLFRFRLLKPIPLGELGKVQYLRLMNHLLRRWLLRSEAGSNPHG